jgi:tRNA-Thr(GGU) m(6)t(6)A37 methyltransferase TsaA
MSNLENPTPKTYALTPIGYVRQQEQGAVLEILEPYRPALKELGQFGYVQVLWWADQADTPEGRGILQCELPYAPGTVAGVFACRSPMRPNPIALTTCFLLDVNPATGQVLLPWIDAEDGTPVLDLKPYIPLSDRPREVRVASRLTGWPEYMEDAAEFFATHTVDFGD